MIIYEMERGDMSSLGEIVNVFIVFREFFLLVFLLIYLIFKLI